MSPEEQQAKLLSEWLDAPPGTAPPDALHADVVESMAVLRPELVAAPALDFDELFDSLRTGPLANSESDEAPVAADESASDDAAADRDAAPDNLVQLNPKRPWWLMAGGGGVAAMAAVLALGIGLSNFDDIFGGGADEAAMSTPVTSSMPEPASTTAEKVAELEEEAEPPEPRRSRKPAFQRNPAEPPRLAQRELAKPVVSAPAGLVAQDPAKLADEGELMDVGGALLAATDAPAGGPAAPPNAVVQGALVHTQIAAATCYNQAVERDSGVQGAVELEWVVSGNRTVGSSVAVDSTGDRKLLRCLQDMLSSVSWPDGSAGEWHERWAFTPVSGDKNRAMPAMDAMMESAE